MDNKIILEINYKYNVLHDRNLQLKLYLQVSNRTSSRNI